MTKAKPVESIISGFTSTILRSHFGKGPRSVYTSLNEAFVYMELRGFLAPMEAILLNQQENNKVLELRDLMMEQMAEEFKRNFWKETGLDVKELYADWNLEDKSGMILGVLEETEVNEEKWPEDVDKKALHSEIVRLSIVGQKEPGSTEIYWLSDRTLLIKREEISTLLEKELIKHGFVEELKLAKRPLEYKLFEESNLVEILKRPILRIYVDWDFKDDKGYAILALQKNDQN